MHSKNNTNLYILPEMLFDTSKVNIDKLEDELFVRKQVRVSVLRLDKIHPLVSGNKIFKLQYFLEDALKSDHKRVLTFGGAYSNHLAATAFACKALQLKSIGIVRGERPGQLSPTLQQCVHDGMELTFISRQEYEKKEETTWLNRMKAKYGACTLIPEGGFHPLGTQGAALILDLVNLDDFTHICTATGTATTLAGLVLAAKPGQTVIGFPVLKGSTDNKKRIKQLTGIQHELHHLWIMDTYHFGGYAKKSEILLEFMNQCWLKYQLPLDFVYTGKMLYGITDCIEKDLFKKESKILCLHTGGLQGNKSLPLNTLLF